MNLVSIVENYNLLPAHAIAMTWLDKAPEGPVFPSSSSHIRYIMGQKWMSILDTEVSIYCGEPKFSRLKYYMTAELFTCIY